VTTSPQSGRGYRSSRTRIRTTRKIIGLPLSGVDEREILGLVDEGLSNDEIADRLYIIPATARTHVGRAMTKLGARDRAQLVVFAYQSGLAT
jgi:Response regulator containing a CheY-like receiver domain and an HTH DNA-binding domain